MKKLFIVTWILMLALAPPLSGFAGMDKDKRIGHDWHSGDMYRMESRVEHEKRFPHGHRKSGPEDDRNCYFDKALAAYFCQFDWDE